MSLIRLLNKKEAGLFFATLEKQIPNKKIRHYNIAIWKFI
jgi:hypothetical protein